MEIAQNAIGQQQAASVSDVKVIRSQNRCGSTSVSRWLRRGRLKSASDLIQRRSAMSLLVERDRCEINLCVDGIQGSQSLPQEGFFIDGNLQMVE